MCNDACEVCDKENTKTFQKIFDLKQIEWPISQEDFIEKFKQVWCKYEQFVDEIYFREIEVKCDFPTNGLRDEFVCYL